MRVNLFLFNRGKVKGTDRAYEGRSLREDNGSTEYLEELDIRIVVMVLSPRKLS